jgi:hypothetical protein
MESDHFVAGASATGAPFCVLKDSLEAYEAAFNEDLSHFYSGLNTLAMLTIQTELAELLPRGVGGTFRR